jgi:signal transduction histidine kinase
LSDQAKASLNAAEERVESLIAFVNDLLDYVKLDAGKMQFESELLNLESSIAPLRNEFESQAEPLAVAVRCADKWNEFVFGDTERLTQLLKNLFANSLRRSPRDGTVWISIGEIAGAVEISVTDEGPMPGQTSQETIFAPFSGWETKGHEGKRRGTGLELAICRLIAQGHNGQIGVRKEGENRTKFWLTLPRPTPAEDAAD